MGKHKTRGVVSMANSGPNTNASQFFITYGPQPSLDLKYTVFGKVIDGWDTLDELEKLQTNPKNHKPVPGLPKRAKRTTCTQARRKPQALGPQMLKSARIKP